MQTLVHWTSEPGVKKIWLSQSNRVSPPRGHLSSRSLWWAICQKTSAHGWGCLVPRRLQCGKRKTLLHEPSRSIAQWTMGTFSVDTGRWEGWTRKIIPSAEPKSQSLSNPLERACVRGRAWAFVSYSRRDWHRSFYNFLLKNMPI